MSTTGYASLLSKGVRAPDDVWEVNDADGHIARIERDASYPGATRAYLDPPPSDVQVRALWRLPASASRPRFYPQDLPFIPAISCTVLEAENRVSATWRDEAGRIDPERAAVFLSSAPEGVADLFATMKKRWAESEAGSEAADVFRPFHELVTKGDGLEWLATLGGADDLDSRFVDGFRDTLRQMTEEGWIEVPVEGVPRFAVKSVSLTRGDRRRTLSLMGSLGLTGLVLSERPLGPVDSA